MTTCGLCAACACWAANGPTAGPLEGPPSRLDVQAARFCRPVHFSAYSSIEPGGQRVEESLSWDDAQKAYTVRGPVLSMMLGWPGARMIPPSQPVPGAAYRIAVRQDPSAPVDRFCQTHFQESARCDPDGSVTYTQVYTDCDLQTYDHVIRLTPDRAGALPLLAVRFADVRGQFGDPLYLSAGSDLRERIR